MYYYYALATVGVRSWWKKYLTALQITQFVIDVVVCYTASFYFFYSNSCNGTAFTALFGSGLLTFYLFLFIKFWMDNYSAVNGASAKEKSQ